MYQTFQLGPGITLRYLHSSRFKQGLLSLQFLRPMCRQEAGLNAIIPDILLRGCQSAPDLRQITAKLDSLYGASIGAQVRRGGDWQTTGLACGFMEDRFALQGDEILAPMTGFLRQLLLEPVTEKGSFRRDYVRSEKRNLISALESQRSDKQAYASSQLFKIMCGSDSFAVPRLGEIAQVKKITAATAYAHYEKLLHEAPVEIFYIGSAPMEQVVALTKPIFEGIPRQVQTLPPQTAFSGGTGRRKTEVQTVTQGKLSMGFTTEITNLDPRFAAMQVMNFIFGGGMNSKLFLKVREEKALCYAITSGYYGSKGILTVDAGIDPACRRKAQNAILAQLRACQQGDIQPRELEAAKKAMLSSLHSIYDSPGAMERYFSAAALSGRYRSPEEYEAQIEAVTPEHVVEAAKTVQLHSVFFLKGGTHE